MWTLEEARKYLKIWLEAEMAIASAQSYNAFGQSLTRANLSEVKERIKFWRAEVERLSDSVENSGMKKRKRVFNVTPIDS